MENLPDPQLPSDEGPLPEGAGSSGGALTPSAPWAPPWAADVMEAVSAGRRVTSDLPEQDVTVSALAAAEVVGGTWSEVFTAAAAIAEQIPDMDLRAVTASCTVLSEDDGVPERECGLVLMFLRGPEAPAADRDGPGYVPGGLVDRALRDLDDES